MRNKTRLTIACGVVTVTAAICLAQNSGAQSATEPPRYFRLDFAVQELDGGKVTNSRHYLTTVATDNLGNSVIRTGSKVPIATGVAGTESSLFTYIDVGVNIDCSRAKVVQGDLAVNVSAEISTALSTSRQPVIRQTKWGASVIVPLGKPTVIFSSDDLTTKSQMQLELTATPIAAH